MLWLDLNLSIEYELLQFGRKVQDFIMNLIEKVIKLLIISLGRFTIKLERGFQGGHRRSRESKNPHNRCNQTHVQIPAHYLSDVWPQISFSICHSTHPLVQPQSVMAQTCRLIYGCTWHIVSILKHLQYHSRFVSSFLLCDANACSALIRSLVGAISMSQSQSTQTKSPLLIIVVQLMLFNRLIRILTTE